jgi:hypothetical protein
MKHTSRRIQSNINNHWQKGCPVNLFDFTPNIGFGKLRSHLRARTVALDYGLPVAGLLFSSCVRDSTKPAIRDRSSSMDGMSISNAT